MVDSGDIGRSETGRREGEEEEEKEESREESWVVEEC